MSEWFVIYADFLARNIISVIPEMEKKGWADE
jgi:sulfur transfer complex TusBCD TusB component (DsrH family)